MNIKVLRTVVVIPTYNERGNIENLIKMILLQQDLLENVDLHILVVDDSSPDGTSKIVISLQKVNNKIHLISGFKKNGLGTAYIRGFKHALNTLQADIVIEMDADFSHNPFDIPRLINEIKRGNDFIIGSRYISGGSIPKNWSLIRRLNSKAGNLLAKKIAGLGKIKDCTGGYRAIKASVIKNIDLNSLGVKGYAFQISLLHAAVKNRANIVEIPINFSERIHGKSKISFSDISEFILTTIVLRFPLLKSTKIAFKLVVSGFIFGLLLIGAYVSIGFNLNLVILIISISMILQGTFTLWWMLYAWNHPEEIKKNKAPKDFNKPYLSFSAIVPARHEEKVIAQTIDALSRINYPENLMEAIIVCKFDDSKTISSVKETIERLNIKNIKLVTFYEEIANKPHALNIGLKESSNDIIVVFDAEDEPNKEIYNVVNTIMQQSNADVLQSGVQLMNYRSTWFSTLNVLEYYFWFKSTLHYFAKSGIIPLGGNTIFFKKQQIYSVSGWDEKCLTEDADIGIRLSIKNAKIQIVYDEKYVTKEESPLTLSGFIKQRTRWSQGFLQIFKKGKWLQLKKSKIRFLAGYILISPLLQTLFFLYIPFSIFIVVYIKLPVWLVMLSIIPFYILILQLITFNIGLYLFTKDYSLKFHFWLPLKILFTFFPFQLILGLSSARAAFRMISNKNIWEKTQHVNAHRTKVIEVNNSYQTAIQ